MTIRYKITNTTSIYLHVSVASAVVTTVAADVTIASAPTTVYPGDKVAKQLLCILFCFYTEFV